MDLTLKFLQAIKYIKVVTLPIGKPCGNNAVCVHVRGSELHAEALRTKSKVVICMNMCPHNSHKAVIDRNQDHVSSSPHSSRPAFTLAQ